MLAFAEREFELSAIQEDGACLRDHLAVYAKHNGSPHEMISTAPPLPRTAAPVWELFCQMKQDANGGRITGTIMRATEWASGIETELWQRRAIQKLDTLFYRVKSRDNRS